ncbi:MAG: hypothetical protein ABJ308_18385 [Halieaceae bacterium]
MKDMRLSRISSLLFAACLALTLAACGGGGGTSDPGFIGGGVDDPGGGTDPDAPLGAGTLSLALTDSAGNPVTNVTSITPGILTVTARDSAGQLAANEVLTATSTLGIVSPESGTALTDLNGIGTFTIAAGDILGAGTVTVTMDTATASVNFQVGEANLRIGRLSGTSFIEGEIEAGATSLPAAGSTPLTVAVVDANNNLVTTVVPVLFGSGCANLVPPLANISTEVNTVNGLATSTYTANGCTGIDNVTAAIVQGNTQAATVALSIASADVNSVAFIAAEPSTIALKGTGGQGREETSQVSFQVLDTTGAAATGVDVTFSLSTSIGGLALTNAVATTNENGIASAIVQAGNVSTSVRVTATIQVDDPANPGTLKELSTVSDKLIVSTGLPDQDSVSLAASLLNPGGGNVDGVESTITVRMADKFNNPVPDGTVAFFTTELGAIEDSCETVEGVCSVIWNSQAPKLPLEYNTELDGPIPELAYVSRIDNRDCPGTGLQGYPCVQPLGSIYGGRSQITVIAIGEESFVDSNGNGLYDPGEIFEDLPEAFLDKNENGIFDNTPPLCAADSTIEPGRACAQGLEEIFFDFDVSGGYNQGNGIYNGSLCTEALEAANQCSRELLNVRRDITIVMGGVVDFQLFDGATPETGGISIGPGGSGRDYVVAVSDIYNNVPSAGTTVSVAAEGCSILGGTSTVPNTSDKGAFELEFQLESQLDNVADVNGQISITVEGDVNTATQIVTYSCIDRAL